MSIANRQINKATNKIIKNFITNGKLPIIEEIQIALSRYFAKNPLGLPTMKLRLAKYREASNNKDWNDTIDEVYEDLTNLYEETLDQSKRILVNFDYTETEKKKIERKIDSLSSKVKELLVLSNNKADYIASFVDDFSSLVNVDTANSNCFLDLRAHELLPMQIKSSIDVAELSNNDIFIEVTPSNLLMNKTISPLSSILDNKANTYWEHKIISETEQMITVKLNISIKNPKFVSRISISPHMPSTTLFEVYVSEDGINSRSVYKKETSNDINIDFNQAKITNIEIYMTRSFSDGKEVVGDIVGSVYYFGINSINIMNVGYENLCETISKPIVITDRNNNQVYISKLSLEVEEDIDYPYNNIEYYVALDNKDIAPKDLDWRKITPINRVSEEDIKNKTPNVLDFNTIHKATPVIFKPTSQANLYKKANGVNLYSLQIESGNMQGKIDLETLEVYRGFNQWKAEYYKCDNNLAHDVSLSDWAVLNNKTIKTYVSGNKFPITAANHHYRWSTNIYCNEATIIPFVVTLDSAIANKKLLISINHSPVLLSPNADGKYEYTLSLKKGRNIIEILYHSSVGEINNTINLSTSFVGQVEAVIADASPMKYVSEFDLLYNVYDNDDSSFSMTEDNYIIVNEAVKAQNVRLRALYSYHTNEEDTGKIRLKAVFTKDPNAQKPAKLSKYTLRVMR